MLVIDFGSELYVWNGKNAGFDLRRAGANLVKRVWDDGFDHTGAENPHPLLGKQFKVGLYQGGLYTVNLLT